MGYQTLANFHDYNIQFLYMLWLLLKTSISILNEDNVFLWYAHNFEKNSNLNRDVRTIFLVRICFITKIRVCLMEWRRSCPFCERQLVKVTDSTYCHPILFICALKIKKITHFCKKGVDKEFFKLLHLGVLTAHFNLLNWVLSPYSWPLCIIITHSSLMFAWLNSKNQNKLIS